MSKCKWHIDLLALLLVAGSFAVRPCRAQVQQPTLGPDGIYYTRQHSFQIPFHTDPGERRIRLVQLFVSQDQGSTWKLAATAQPNERFFTYQAQGDGHYWFTVRTVDHDGRAYPVVVEQAKPGLKICVDTQPPTVVLRALPPVQPGTVGVEWEVRDNHLLDMDSLVLHYRPQGNGEWLPLNVTRRAPMSFQSWTPTTNATLEVRLQVKDRAGNLGEARTTVSSSPLAHSGGSDSSDRPQSPGGGSRSDVALVNTKRISLHFEITEVGKSGVAEVELWYTRDGGRKWQKYPEISRPQSPFIFEAPEEGLYGFTLVARSGVGLSEQPPREGDTPQVWVEVDLTKPVVKLINVEVGRGADLGTLTILWTATDKHLGRQPINLFYAEKADGPWTQIASNLENTGRYVWRMPESVPYQFYVRVAAADRAGNVGIADSPRPIAVDLSQPKVRNIKIEPGKGP